MYPLPLAPPAGQGVVADRPWREGLRDRAQRYRQVQPVQGGQGRTAGRRRRSLARTGAEDRRIAPGTAACRRTDSVRRGGRGPGGSRQAARRVPPPEPEHPYRRRPGAPLAGPAGTRGARWLAPAATGGQHPQPPAVAGRQDPRRTLRRLASARAAGPGAGRRAGPAAAGRTDQPPGHRRHRLARGSAAGLQRRGAVHYPRPRLPAIPGDPHPRGWIVAT